MNASRIAKTIAFVMALLGCCISPLLQQQALAQDGQNQPAAATTIATIPTNPLC